MNILARLLGVRKVESPTQVRVILPRWMVRLYPRIADVTIARFEHPEKVEKLSPRSFLINLA